MYENVDATRRAVLRATAGAFGLSTVGSATAHTGTTDGDLGSYFDSNRADAAENTDVVGYHSMGGVGPSSESGGSDDPHYGGLSELRVHDDVAVVSVFSSRDPTPGRGLGILDVSEFTRAESADELTDAELHVRSFFGNENGAAACMDVKLSDDGQYAFVAKQPLTALFGEEDDGTDDDTADGGADGAALEVVDISDPDAPELVTQTTLSIWALGPHNAFYHQINGREYVFTTHGEDGLTGGINVFEFDRDLGSLEHVNWWNFSAELSQPETEIDDSGGAYYAHDVTVQDDPKTGRPLAYLANWDAGTRVLDLSDPTNIEEIGLFEMERAHHTVPAPTLIDGTRVFVAGHETPSGTRPRTEGATGHYYLVDADPLDAVLEGDRDDPVYLGLSSTMTDAGVSPATRESAAMYDPDDPDRRELDHWILLESAAADWEDAPGFEYEAEHDEAYGGFDDFNLSSHNLDVDGDGRVTLGHYHAGTRFLEIDAEEGTLEPTGYSRVGPDVPDDATLGALTSGTPFHWCGVWRNGLAFAGGINGGPQVLSHEGVDVGRDRPIDASIDRDPDASAFTAGQTTKVTLAVGADEPVRVQDRIPASWDVVAGDVHTVRIGDRQVVVADEPIESGTVVYYAEAPAETGTFRFGPPEYARPEAPLFGGGTGVTSEYPRKENGAIVERTVAAVET